MDLHVLLFVDFFPAAASNTFTCRTSPLLAHSAFYPYCCVYVRMHMFVCAFRCGTDSLFKITAAGKIAANDAPCLRALQNHLCNMHSRAVLLLQREHKLLQDVPPAGIMAAPLDATRLTWRASLGGLPGLLYGGATFQLDLEFPADYNQSPPQIMFRTIPYHPNIHPQTGRVSVLLACNVLRWSSDLTLRDVLLGVQTLLSRPRLEPEHVIHGAAAADLLRADGSCFGRLATSCVEASLRVVRGLSPHVGINPNIDFFSEVSRPFSGVAIPPKVRPAAPLLRVDFERYHSAWKQIASTTPDARPATRSLQHVTAPGQRPSADCVSLSSPVLDSASPILVLAGQTMHACHATSGDSHTVPRESSPVLEDQLIADDLVTWSRSLCEEDL